MLEVSSIICVPVVESILTHLLTGSAWVTLENVKVPVENLVGKENKGFLTLMSSKCASRKNISLSLACLLSFRFLLTVLVKTSTENAS